MEREAGNEFGLTQTRAKGVRGNLERKSQNQCPQEENDAVLAFGRGVLSQEFRNRTFVGLVVVVDSPASLNHPSSK
jgi:hypothetical protein